LISNIVSDIARRGLLGDEQSAPRPPPALARPDDRVDPIGENLQAIAMLTRDWKTTSVAASG